MGTKDVSLSRVLTGCEWTVHEESENFITCSWRNLACVIWLRCTPEDVGPRAVRQVIQTVSMENPRGIGLVTLVAATASPPSASTRGRIAGHLNDAAETIRYSGVILEGTGFRAAMVRSIVGGIMQLGRFPFIHRVTSWAQLPSDLGDKLPELQSPSSQAAMQVTFDLIHDCLDSRYGRLRAS